MEGAVPTKGEQSDDDMGYQTKKQPGQLLDQFMAISSVLGPLRRLLSIVEGKKV